MANAKKIGFTFAQIAVGCLAGVVAGVVSLSLINFAWRGLQQLNLGTFLTALLLLASFLIFFGGIVAATAEGVRQMGRFIPRQASRRKIYEGSFLGACAAVAVLSVTRSDWVGTLDEWGGPVKVLGTLLYFIVVLPVKTATFWVPSLLVLLIAAPIGAAIGYNLPPAEAKATQTEAAEESSGKKGVKEAK